MAEEKNKEKRKERRLIRDLFKSIDKLHLKGKELK